MQFVNTDGTHYVGFHYSHFAYLWFYFSIMRSINIPSLAMVDAVNHAMHTQFSWYVPQFWLSHVVPYTLLTILNVQSFLFLYF
jgi:hypothetical protein